MIKKFLALIIMVASIIVGGCGDNKSDDKTVAISFANSTSSWQRNGAIMQKALEDDGFKVDIQYADNSQQQIDHIKELIESKPKCIVIGAIDSKALAEPLEAAKENNIPIIAFDRIIFDTDALSYYASYDNEAIGSAMAEYFEAALNLKNGGGAYNIEFFAGAPTDNNAHVFFKNSMEILEPYLKTGQLVCQSKQTDFNSVAVADWDSKNARTRIKQLLDNYYSSGQPLQVVLSPNDDIAGVILEEMRSRGMPAPLISGLDADPEAIKRIKAGQQTFTISKDPELLTNRCVRMIKAVVEGTQPSINDVKTYDNGKKIVPSYLCTPYIIDKTNIDAY